MFLVFLHIFGNNLLYSTFLTLFIYLKENAFLNVFLILEISVLASMIATMVCTGER